MNNTTFGKEYLKELEMEVNATRKCLERINKDMFDFKPHEKSMAMGYLTLIVAEVPKWLAIMATDADINFATFTHPKIESAEEMVRFFNENVGLARVALEKITDEEMQQPFYLKAGDKVLMTMTRQVGISSSIRHFVHHRGQLTVYMRLNNIAVPAIYGPSADDNQYQ